MILIEHGYLHTTHRAIKYTLMVRKLLGNHYVSYVAWVSLLGLKCGHEALAMLDIAPEFKTFVRWFIEIDEKGEV